jgi:hypothetical protein
MLVMRRAFIRGQSPEKRGALRGGVLMKPMTLDSETADFHAGTAAQGFPFQREIMDRLRGPGGYYNIGNLIGIATGVAVQLAQAPAEMSAAGAVGNYLAGDFSGAMLTVATLVFMASGEAYHRAWADGFPANAALVRLGDLTSGIGALALGVGLLTLGQPILAATSGLLHAFGKFGSALCRPKRDSAYDWPWIFRAVVIESRVPAVLAALLELARLAPALADGGQVASSVTAAALLVCYLIWTKADLLLLKS